MFAKWIAIAAVGLGTGCSGATQTNPERPPEGARLVDLGVRSLHIDCRGSGGPTVILDADHGAPSSTVSAEAAALRTSRRVCTYDRAGLGKSAADPVGPRTVQLLVYDLRAALEAAGEAGPFVLVAHGYASYAARLYAAQYPDDIAGLVLVRPVHLGMEEALMNLLTADARATWLEAADAREPVDYPRSRALMSAAFPEGVRAAVVPGTIDLSAGSRGESHADAAKKLTALAARLQTKLAESLDARTFSDVEAAVAAVSGAGGSAQAQ